MTLLVSVEQGKRHLRIDDDQDADAEVTDLIHQASALVLNYLKEPGDFTWLDSSGETNPGDSPAEPVPYAVQAATLQLLTALYENRGDDGGELSKFQQGYLPPAVTAMLYPLRDPALA